MPRELGKYMQMRVANMKTFWSEYGNTAFLVYTDEGRRDCFWECMEGDANICFIGIPSTSPTLPFRAANPSGRKNAPSSEKKCQNDYIITQGRQKNARTQKMGNFFQVYLQFYQQRKEGPLLQNTIFS